MTTSKEPNLVVGKLYEYLPGHPTAILPEPRRSSGSWKSPNKVRQGQTVMLLERLPKTVSYIRVHVIETDQTGWIWTGVVNGREPYNELKNPYIPAISKLLRRLI